MAPPLIVLSYDFVRNHQYCHLLVQFPLTPMGVLAPESAHDVSGNCPAHVSAESPSNISPNPSEVISVSEPLVNF